MSPCGVAKRLVATRIYITVLHLAVECNGSGSILWYVSWVWGRHCCVMLGGVRWRSWYTFKSILQMILVFLDEKIVYDGYYVMDTMDVICWGCVIIRSFTCRSLAWWVW